MKVFIFLPEATEYKFDGSKIQMNFSIKIAVTLFTFFFGVSIFFFWNVYSQTLPAVEVPIEKSVNLTAPIKIDFCSLSNYSDEYEDRIIEIDGVLATGDRVRLGMLYPIGCGFPKDPRDKYKDMYANLIHIDLQSYKVLLGTLTEETRNGGFSYNEVNVRVVGKLTSKIIGSSTKLYTIIPIKIEKTSSIRNSTAYGGA